MLWTDSSVLILVLITITLCAKIVQREQMEMMILIIGKVVRVWLGNRFKRQEA